MEFGKVSYANIYYLRSSFYFINKELVKSIAENRYKNVKITLTSIKLMYIKPKQLLVKPISILGCTTDTC